MNIGFGSQAKGNGYTRPHQLTANVGVTADKVLSVMRELAITAQTINGAPQIAGVEADMIVNVLAERGDCPKATTTLRGVS